MTTNRRRLGALVSAGVLTFGLAACSVDEGADEASSSAAEGASSSEDAASSAGESADDAASADDVAEGEEISIDEFLAMVQEPGEDMLSRYSTVLTVDSEGETIEAQGQVDLSSDPSAMQLTMTVPGVGEVELITVGGELYIAVPGMTPEGKYLQDSSGAFGDQTALDDIDVTGQWDAWKEGAQKVVYLGEEDVDGTDMGHYQLTVDQAAAAAAMGDEAAATAAAGSEPVVYDVWLDADNLMRRMTFDVDATSADMRMDDWGQTPQIEAPPADQIMDVGDLGTLGGLDEGDNG